MNMDEYQDQCSNTFRPPETVPESNWNLYLTLGLCSESGELADQLVKGFKDDIQFSREDLISEIGDVLWYVAMLAHVNSIDLSHVAWSNIEKLKSRYADNRS